MKNITTIIFIGLIIRIIIATISAPDKSSHRVYDRRQKWWKGFINEFKDPKPWILIFGFTTIIYLIFAVLIP
jgi:hypothetical protein